MADTAPQARGVGMVAMDDVANSEDWAALWGLPWADLMADADHFCK